MGRRELGAMGKYSDGEDKFHIMIPKRFFKQVKDLKGEQIRVLINDEI